MPEEATDKSPNDPTGLWRQWFDTSSRVWSNVVDGRKETYVDPYGVYLSWLKNVGEAREQMKANFFGMMDPKEAWQRWFDGMIEEWRSAAQRGADPLGLTTHFLEMIEEARAKMQAEGNFPADPFTFLKQWYDATNEAWANAIGKVIGTEKFMEGVSRYLESYTSFHRTFRRASEEYFRNLQLPTRSDVARVAELVITLEEKVDRIEDAFEDFQDGYAHLATSEAVAGLEEQLELEGKAVEGLAKRLDQLESKLDKVLAALKKFEAKEQVESSKPINTERRKAAKKNANSQSESIEKEAKGGGFHG
jgi:polyhydroxyalkanoic acid synthase PhaR subunit